MDQDETKKNIRTVQIFERVMINFWTPNDPNQMLLRLKKRIILQNVHEEWRLIYGRGI